MMDLNQFFYDRLAIYNQFTLPYISTVHDILQCIDKQKSEKTITGLGGVGMEAIINGGLKLHGYTLNHFTELRYLP